MAVKVGEDVFTIDMEDNSSADGFYEKLKEMNNKWVTAGGLT